MLACRCLNADKSMLLQNRNYGFASLFAKFSGKLIFSLELCFFASGKCCAGGIMPDQKLAEAFHAFQNLFGIYLCGNYNSARANICLNVYLLHLITYGKIPRIETRGAFYER